MQQRQSFNFQPKRWSFWAVMQMPFTNQAETNVENRQSLQWWFGNAVDSSTWNELSFSAVQQHHFAIRLGRRHTDKKDVLTADYSFSEPCVKHEKNYFYFLPIEFPSEEHCFGCLYQGEVIISVWGLQTATRHCHRGCHRSSASRGTFHYSLLSFLWSRYGTSGAWKELSSRQKTWPWKGLGHEGSGPPRSWGDVAR